MLQESVSPL